MPARYLCQTLTLRLTLLLTLLCILLRQHYIMIWIHNDDMMNSYGNELICWCTYTLALDLDTVCLLLVCLPLFFLPQLRLNTATIPIRKKTHNQQYNYGSNRCRRSCRNCIDNSRNKTNYSKSKKKSMCIRLPHYYEYGPLLLDQSALDKNLIRPCFRILRMNCPPAGDGLHRIIRCGECSLH